MREHSSTTDGEGIGRNPPSLGGLRREAPVFRRSALSRMQGIDSSPRLESGHVARDNKRPHIYGREY